MGKIFCLETEWNKSKHDLKYKSSAQSLLEFLENSKGIQYTFRNVATETDFEYYIHHLYYDSYKLYDIVYLCFHGEKSNIEFANRTHIDLLEFAKNNPGIFEGKNVHFGCCSTLAITEDDIKLFKKESGARMVSDYAVDVEFINSFVFELWLLNAISENPQYAGKRICDLAHSRMPYYAQKFKFIAF